MKSISISEFKAHCLRLLDEVRRSGEGLMVTKRGKKVAVVLPAQAIDVPDYRFGLFRDSVRVVGDIVSPLDVEWESSK